MSNRTAFDLIQSGPASCSFPTSPYANLIQSARVPFVMATSPFRAVPRFAVYVSPSGGGLGLSDATSNAGCAYATEARRIKRQRTRVYYDGPSVGPQHPAGVPLRHGANGNCLDHLQGP